MRRQQRELTETNHWSKTVTVYHGVRESAKFKNLGHVSVFQLQINAPDTNRATDKKRRDEIRRSKIFDFEAPEYKDFTISQEIKKKKNKK